jgi:hypothetical protein
MSPRPAGIGDTSRDRHVAPDESARGGLSHAVRFLGSPLRYRAERRVWPLNMAGSGVAAHRRSRFSILQQYGESN